jgi:hypothetical protein
MKPLPRLEDEAAMLERGRRSALAAARNEAEAGLRDAYTAMHNCEWDKLSATLRTARMCVSRLRWIDRQWKALEQA